MINIYKQDCFAIIKFDFDRITLDLVRDIEGRKYNEQFKYWTIPLEKLDEFCSCCDEITLPYELHNGVYIHKQINQPKQAFANKENKQKLLAFLRLQDQPVFYIKVNPEFTHLDRLRPFTSTIKGDHLFFSAENLWDVLQECKKIGVQVIM